MTEQHRERFTRPWAILALAALLFGALMLTHNITALYFGPLVGLDDEWRAQGASEAEIEMTAFGFDHVRRHGVMVHTGMMGGHEPVTLSETPDHVIGRDAYGRTVKMFRTSSTRSPCPR